MKKRTREERDRPGRAERALDAALDDERLAHEAVGRADELEHLDLDASALEHEAHRRADDREHRREHDDREERRRRDAAAHEAGEPLGPRLVGLDVVDRRQLLELADHVGELGVGHLGRDVDLDRRRERLDRQRRELAAAVLVAPELARASPLET